MMFCEYEDAFYSGNEVVIVPEKQNLLVNVSGRSTALKMFLMNEPLDRIIRTIDCLNEQKFARIYQTTRKVETEKCLHAIGLIIVHPDDPGKILVHQEKFANSDYHKFEGSNSVQLTWQSEESEDAALERLLRQEVFGMHQYERMQRLVEPISEGSVGQFMVADALVNLRIMRMTPLGLNLRFFSPRVSNIHWEDYSSFLHKANQMRAGVEEMVDFTFREYFPHQYHSRELIIAKLNQEIMAI